HWFAPEGKNAQFFSQDRFCADPGDNTSVRCFIICAEARRIQRGRENFDFPGFSEESFEMISPIQPDFGKPRVEA
ncbi:MAG: hypothetical protein ACK58T_49530, partial [Phycisphaerae bacterium]